MAHRVYRRSSARAVVWIALIVAFVGVVIGYGTCSKQKGLVSTLDCHYTVIDLKSGGYRVRPALADIKQRETFEEITRRLKPYAAITGTFYDENHRPLGDIVINGKIACRGCQRQAIGFTSNGRIRFLERKGSSRIDWRGCDAGVACGPRLIRSGKIDINVQRDGFRKGAAKLEARRCAIGATRDGKLVLLAVKDYVTLKKLAEAMQQLGAVDAINLDGGALCGFYLKGKCLAEPILPVSNVIAISRTKP